MTTERETVFCPKCKLVQYRRPKDTCRRCGTSTTPPPPEPVKVVNVHVAPQKPIKLSVPSLAYACAFVLRIHRDGMLMSQREAAAAFGCPRTYISKMEQGTHVPFLANLMRFAQVYKVTIAEMMTEIVAAQKLREGGCD